MDEEKITKENCPAYEAGLCDGTECEQCEWD